MGKRRGRSVSIKKILKDYSDEVKQAAVDALNRNAEMLAGNMKDALDVAGIQRRSGKLESSFTVGEANMKNLDARVISEVYAPMPKKPGSRNKNVYYPAGGVPYGRLIEFSPRINKPFFYGTFYAKKNAIIDDVFRACREAGKK